MNQQNLNNSSNVWNFGEIPAMERGVPEKPHARPLGRRLADAMDALENVAKEGFNKYDNYKYLRAADLANTIRRPLAKAGVALMVSVCNWTQETAPTKQGEQQIHTVLFAVRLENADDPRDYIVTYWPVEAMDRGDKGFGKCVTTVMKEAMRSVLSLGGDDDIETESPEKHGTPTSAPRQQSQTRTHTAPSQPPPAAPAPAPDMIPVAEPTMPDLKGDGTLGVAWAAWFEDLLHANGKALPSLVAAISAQGEEKAALMNGSDDIADWNAELLEGMVRWVRAKPRAPTNGRTQQAKAHHANGAAVGGA